MAAYQGTGMNNRRKLVIALGAGALAAPLSSLAQAPAAKVARIGLLGPGSTTGNEPWVAALLANLRDLGYVEGSNLGIEFRWAEGRNDRLPELAAELVRLKVDLIVTYQTPAALAAKQATNSIPIVMAAAADPVATGLITSLARPGGNVTGLSAAVSELAAKNLEIILEILPSAKRVAVLVNVADSFAKSFLERIQLASRALGIELQAVMVRAGEPLGVAFEEIAKARASAVLVQPSLPYERVVEMALQHRLASAAAGQGFADAGGLLAYTQSIAERDRQAALYIDKILKGAKPADLPVRQPAKFELVINLRTARRIGLKIPPGVLARADRLIE
jgi:putative tryptophan/tyrosine transport system substrate-binding protein